MTQVTISEADGKAVIDIEGHAGFNPGNDIVCAAISTLSDQLNNMLLAMSEKGQLEKIFIKRSDGHHHAEICIDKAYDREWQAVKEMALTGFRMVSESYPDYVKVHAS